MENTCKKHNQEFESWCFKCNKAFCSICIQNGETCHKINFFDNSIIEYKRYISGMCELHKKQLISGCINCKRAFCINCIREKVDCMDIFHSYMEFNEYKNLLLAYPTQIDSIENTIFLDYQSNILTNILKYKQIINEMKLHEQMAYKVIQDILLKSFYQFKSQLIYLTNKLNKNCSQLINLNNYMKLMKNKYKKGYKCNSYSEFQKYSNISPKFKIQMSDILKRIDENIPHISKSNDKSYLNIVELILENSKLITNLKESKFPTVNAYFLEKPSQYLDNMSNYYSNLAKLNEFCLELKLITFENLYQSKAQIFFNYFNVVKKHRQIVLKHCKAISDGIKIQYYSCKFEKFRKYSPYLFYFEFQKNSPGIIHMKNLANNNQFKINSYIQDEDNYTDCEQFRNEFFICGGHFNSYLSNCQIISFNILNLPDTRMINTQNYMARSALVSTPFNLFLIGGIFRRGISARCEIYNSLQAQWKNTFELNNPNSCTVALFTYPREIFIFGSANNQIFEKISLDNKGDPIQKWMLLNIKNGLKRISGIAYQSSLYEICLFGGGGIIQNNKTNIAIGLNGKNDYEDFFSLSLYPFLYYSRKILFGVKFCIDDFDGSKVRINNNKILIVGASIPRRIYSIDIKNFSWISQYVDF